MTTIQMARWKEMRTDESRMVENRLRNDGFDQVDAYRYNSASLRVRIVDKRFESVSRDERDEIVEPFIEKLPPSTQSDIVALVLLAPSEISQGGPALRELMLNAEFEDPSPSML